MTACALVGTHRSLNVSGVPLSSWSNIPGTISLSNFTQLTLLDISNTGLTGALPTSLRLLTDLRYPPRRADVVNCAGL